MISKLLKLLPRRRRDRFDAPVAQTQEPQIPHPARKIVDIYSSYGLRDYISKEIVNALSYLNFHANTGKALNRKYYKALRELKLEAARGAYCRGLSESDTTEFLKKINQTLESHKLATQYYADELRRRR